LSQAIVSGLTFSTLLTLVTTPATLALPHQLKLMYQKGRDRAKRYFNKGDQQLGPT
jgi:hypothetical protein